MSPMRTVRNRLARAIAIGSSVLLTVAAAAVLGPDRAGTFFVVLALIIAASTVGHLGSDILVLRLVAANDTNTRTLIQLVSCCSLGAGSAAGLLFVGVLGRGEPGLVGEWGG